MLVRNRVRPRRIVGMPPSGDTDDVQLSEEGRELTEWIEGAARFMLKDTASRRLHRQLRRDKNASDSRLSGAPHYQPKTERK